MNIIKDHTEDFRRFLSDISNAMTEEELNNTLGLVHIIYDEGWRHSYSLATIQLQKFEKFNDVLGQIGENVKSLIDKILEEIENYQPEDEKSDLKAVCLKRCHRSLEKLFDHINLELTRFDKISDLDRKIASLSENLKKIDECSEKIKNVEKQAEKLEKDYKNQRSEAITILGVFTAIIGVIGVGVTLSASILSNIGSIGTWRLYALTLLIVFFVINILSFLFDFLRDMTDKERKQSEYFWIVNIGLLFFSFVCFLLSVLMK